MIGCRDLIYHAWQERLCIPAFNVPHLPMVAAVVKAAIEADAFVFISSARLEWYKFAAKGPEFVKEAYDAVSNLDYTRLHLDHVPVIDEDDVKVDYLSDIGKALDLGYDSVMVDGSRLSLEENIEATYAVAEMAHQKGVPCEAELGAILGHEAGPLPDYEELFNSGRGFTVVDEAEKFVHESECDWLSVAVGNIHGAISAAARDKKKVNARLNIDRIQAIRDAVGIPLVLHGGSGIQREYMLEAIANGIAKVNVAAEIRQAYEAEYNQTQSIESAQNACYERTLWILRDELSLAGKRKTILGK